MKLTATELAFVRRKGLYNTEMCDRRETLLNQTLRYTITGKPEAYCSAACRDLVFFGDCREVRMRSTPENCAYSGATLEGRNRGTIYCSNKCRMRENRLKGAAASRIPNNEVAKSTSCDGENGREGQTLHAVASGAEKHRLLGKTSVTASQRRHGGGDVRGRHERHC